MAKFLSPDGSFSPSHFINPCKDGDTPEYNALLMCPTPPKGVYSSQIAVDLTKQAAIADSTGYLLWPDNHTRHLAWANVMATMLDTPPARTVSNKAILLANAYTAWNFGHNLSTLLFTLKDTANHTDALIVLNRRTFKECPNTQKIVHFYVPDESRWFFVEEDEVVHFERLIITSNHWFHLHELQAIPVAQDLSSRIWSSVDPSNSVQYDRVVLCKLAHHAMARRCGILPDDAANKLRADGWFIIDAVAMDFFEIVRIVSLCKEIILGSGSVNYAHRRFINPQAKLIFWFVDNSYQTFFWGEANAKQTIGCQEYQFQQPDSVKRLLDFVVVPSNIPLTQN